MTMTMTMQMNLTHNITHKDLVKQCLGYLSLLPNSCFRKMLGGLGMRGFLDLEGCYKGRFYAFEIKTGTGKLSECQKARIEAIRKAGGVALELRCIEQLHEVFKSENPQIELF